MAFNQHTGYIATGKCGQLWNQPWMCHGYLNTLSMSTRFVARNFERLDKIFLCHAFMLYPVVGFGQSVVYTLSSGIIALHFDRFQNLAFSVAVLGFYTGVAFWPYLSQELLSRFGYSKTMLAISISQVIHIISGILFFHPSENHPSESGNRLKTNNWAYFV